MRLLVAVNSSEDPGEEDFAIINFDLDTAQRISARRRILKAAIGGDPELYCMRFWVPNKILWFEKREEFSEEFLSLLEKVDHSDEPFLALPETLDLTFLDDPNNRIDVEAQQLHIEDEVFCWLCHDEYGGVQLSTAAFSYDVLAKWL